MMEQKDTTTTEPGAGRTRAFGRDLAAAAQAVPASEPVVLLRGTDRFAPHMLMDYAARLQETGDAEGAAEARDHAATIRAWQAGQAGRQL